MIRRPPRSTPLYSSAASDVYKRLGGGLDDAVAANKEKGFYNHSANAVTKTGPMYCFWEVKEGISAEEFQEFIDGPSGPGFGQDALMNICKPIDSSLMNGQTPYPPVFS